jgi:hypothetical protein
MRQENGMRFDRCIGLQDKTESGDAFDANVLTCEDKPLNIGEGIRLANRAYRYDGDDNLGNSHFTALEPFPQPQTVEKAYKDHFIVLEIYTMKNGHFYVWPYVQGGETSSGNYTRRGFRFAGEFDTREAAEQAGFEAGEQEVEACYV